MQTFVQYCIDFVYYGSSIVRLKINYFLYYQHENNSIAVCKLLYLMFSNDVDRGKNADLPPRL